MTSLRRWWVAAVICLSASPVFAQDKSKTDKVEQPAPQDVTIETADGILLRGTYYQSLEGKDSVPIILLPDFQNSDKTPGSRGDYRNLCLLLQAEGHAPLALDWRGIGDSKTTKLGGQIKVEKLRSDVLVSVMKFDLEAAKNWLMAKNNAGECNIDRLAIVAAGATTPVAVNWAVQDWSWPVLPGRGKQGQDVKGVILLSPTWNSAGFGIDSGINFLAAQPMISVQIGVGARGAGSNSKVVKDAVKIDERIKAARPESKDATEEEKAKRRTLFYVEYDTQFQGTLLLGQQNRLLEEHIKKFIELRLVEPAYPWAHRQ